MNKKLKILGIVLVGLFLLSVFKNGLVQAVVSGALSKATHVPVRIGSTQVGLISTSIRLKNIRVFNPRNFPEPLMLHVPLAFIDFEPADLFKGRLHFKDVKLDMRELIVLKDRNGRLNVDVMKPAGTGRQGPKEQKASQAPQFVIDRLSISIGKVVYKDYSQGGSPQVQVFEVNIQNRTYTNVTNATAVVSLVMFEALTRTSLSRLADLDVSMFKSGAQGAILEGLGLVGGGADQLESTAKGFLELFK